MINPNSLSRFRNSFVAGGAALTLAAAGCNEPAKKYDNKTEMALQEVIQPKLRSAASRIISFAKKHPNLTSIYAGTDRISLTVRGTKNEANGVKDGGELEVVARRLGKSSKLVISQVIAVGADSHTNNVGKNEPDYGSKSLTLYAPGGAGQLYETGIGNDHTQGWAAESIGNKVLDTSVKELYAPNAKGEPTNPVITAQKVVKHMPYALDKAIASID